jgi:hypothetical protein
VTTGKIRRKDGAKVGWKIGRLSYRDEEEKGTGECYKIKEC